jgi:hypothetical protein
MPRFFTPTAIVHSPLYGPTPAMDFYPGLFADTSDAPLTLKACQAQLDIDRH